MAKTKANKKLSATNAKVGVGFTTRPLSRFSIKSMLIFVVVFGAIGGYLLFRSFAATPLVTSLEAEQMSLPAGGSVVTDSTASGGRAVTLNSAGAATGSVNFASPVNSLTVVAKGAQCSGSPTMTVLVDGTAVLTNKAVTSSWAGYSFTPSSAWGSGVHSIAVKFTNPYSVAKRRTNCTRTLSVDVTRFYGPAPAPTPAPTVTLSASPASVSSGQSATLTWSSANATACNASGAWSGAQATTGSVATGALNQTSTYTLTCTGAGGTATQSTTVTVAGATTSLLPTGITGNWTLKFDDEFDGTSLDTTKWSNCWFAPSCGQMNNVSTQPSNVTVSGGNLVLTLSSASSGALVSTNPNGGANPGYQFQYGVVEARIYFPGNGTNCYNWPAFWTDGQSWPANGENDIAEVLSGPMTVNYHSSSGSHNQGAVPGYWCGGFHTYALQRQAGTAKVYYDGTLVKTYTTDDAGAAQYVILNVGSDSMYPIYGAASQVKVDYVRAWQ